MSIKRSTKENIIGKAKIVAGMIIAAVLLTLAVGNIQFRSALELFARVGIGYLMAAVAFLACAYFVRILRWTVMLRTFDATVTWRQACGPFLASFALNNILPLRVGDVMRCFGFQEVLHIKPTRMFASLIVERILDLTTLLCFAAVILWWFESELRPFAYLRAGALLLAVTAIPLVIGVLIPSIPMFFVTIVRHLPFVRRSKIARNIISFAMRSIRSLATIGAGGRVPLLILLSIAGWALEGSVYYAVVYALHGSVRSVGPLLSMVSGTLATLIPSTPGYVGTFDFFAKLGLTASGETQTLAAVEALTVHAVLWLPVTLAGVGYVSYEHGILPTLRLIFQQKSAKLNATIN